MEILDVDLLAFETGSAEERRAVVDGVLRSLATGFVYVEHDLSIDLIDEAYAQLEAFFTLPQERKDTYGAGLQRAERLHGPAGRDGGDRRRTRLEGDAQLGAPLGDGHRCERSIPTATVRRPFPSTTCRGSAL